VIFDCDTNGVARKLKGHLRQIQSLSWSACDRYLLSASQDWRAVLWDLATGERLRTVRFEAPIFIAELHPTNHLLFVVALFDDQPVLVDISDAEPIKRTLPSAPKRTDEELENASEKQTAQDAKQTTTVASFSASGDHLVCGTNKGWLNIISTSTCQTLASSRISTSIVILIKLTTTGKDMVVNCSDRTIRTFSLPDMTAPGFSFDTFHLEPKRKYQDVINRLSWNHVGWNPSGEYVIASTLMNHSIYIWEEVEGSLVKILEAPDEISVLDFHPHKPWLAAVGVDEGRVYIWSVPTPQSWAALAPDFVEVEENVEYAEIHDEFDIQPAEELTKRRLDLEDEEIDVMTKDPDRRTQVGNFVMPVLMDIEPSDDEDEVVAIGAGQFRRKSPVKDWRAGEMEVTPSGDEGGRRTANGSTSGRAGNGAKRKQRD
jgi:COMPASS component SWD1